MKVTRIPAVLGRKVIGSVLICRTTEYDSSGYESWEIVEYVPVPSSKSLEHGDLPCFNSEDGAVAWLRAQSRNR